MHKVKIFKDIKTEAIFQERGYVKFGKIDSLSLNALIDLNDKLKIPDFFGCGYNCGMNSDKPDLRRIMQDEISRIIQPFTNELLDNYEPYTATYVNKMPGETCFIAAHQDFTYAQEPEFTSFMCFIPLVDTTVHNAALGFIPKSHLFYDKIRAFPHDKSAVTENEIRLMAYLEIQDLKAGEIVFFNQNTIHGSFANYSNAERPAVSVSFVKTGEKILTYIYNPKTNGNTIFKYEVDKYAIVNYNNPILTQMYQHGEINIPYTLLAEIDCKTQDTSWESIEQKLLSQNLLPNPSYQKLIDKYYKDIEVPKTLFGRIYKRYKRIISKKLHA